MTISLIQGIVAFINRSRQEIFTSKPQGIVCLWSTPADFVLWET